MVHEKLAQQVDELLPRLTAVSVDGAVRALLRQGEDPGGGIGVFRLVEHLLGNPGLGDVEIVWAYDRLRPTLRSVLEQIPSLYFFEGD